MPEKNLLEGRTIYLGSQFLRLGSVGLGLPAPSQWVGGKAEELGIRNAQQRPLACEGHKGEREGGVSQGHNNLPKACPPVMASYTSTTFQ